MNIFQLISIQVVTFVVIVLFLWWLLQANITRAIKRLQVLNQQNMEKEKILKEEIERAKKEASVEIEKGKSLAEQMREETRQEAEKFREDTIGKSKDEARRIIDSAIKDGKRKQEELIHEMQNHSIDIAAEMVRYILSDRNMENLHVQLVDELTQDIQGLDQRHFDIKDSVAELISAIALQERQKEKLMSVLSSKLGRTVTLNVTHNPEIVSGLIIKMGALIIDGSIKNKLKKLVPIMKDRFMQGKD